MPGPTGPAQSTELVGDPGAPVAAPVDAAPVVAAPVGRAEVVDDDERAEANEGPFPTPGGGGTGPIDPIYDVERVERALARRVARRSGA
ncbi:MAG TPA: hypothetical protein VFS32_12680 [Candidatus Limnocylindrales bacterium]|nr:hypothetical protein [Candidatus Limnocylindrales bacterium]